MAPENVDTYEKQEAGRADQPELSEDQLKFWPGLRLAAALTSLIAVTSLRLDDSPATLQPKLLTLLEVASDLRLDMQNVRRNKLSLRQSPGGGQFFGATLWVDEELDLEALLNLFTRYDDRRDALLDAMLEVFREGRLLGIPPEPFAASHPLLFNELDNYFDLLYNKCLDTGLLLPLPIGKELIAVARGDAEQDASDPPSPLNSRAKRDRTNENIHLEEQNYPDPIFVAQSALLRVVELAPPSDIAHRLQTLKALSNLVELEMVSAASDARAESLTWKQIGEYVGISESAALRRFDEGAHLRYQETQKRRRSQR